MSCTLSHECRVMLIAELLTASTDATRGWLRAEMNRTVDPMLDSIFNRLKTKLTNGLGRTQSAGDGDYGQMVNRNQSFKDKSSNAQTHQSSTFIPQPSTLSTFNPTSSHFKPQFVKMNYFYQQQQNGPNHLDSISNQKLSIQSRPMKIKEEIYPLPAGHDQSCSYAPLSNVQSNHNLTDQLSNNNEEYENFQTNFPDTQMLPQPQQFAHNKFNDEECDCDECVDGGIKVKEEDEEGQIDDESSRPVKRPRMDTTHLNNAIHIMEEDQHQKILELSQYLLTPYVPQQTHSITPHNKISNEEENENIDNNKVANGLFDDDKRQNKKERIESEVIDTRETIGDYSRDNSDTSIVIEQEKMDANYAIEEEMPTANQIQPDLVQSNRQLQCPDCHKSFVCISKLQQHLRVHTGERPFQCDVCDKRFRTKGHLVRHQLIHQNIKNFRCLDCDKQFTQKHSLDAHLLIHSGERPFSCRHCEKSFKDAGDRNRHEQAIHLHVKPYRCKQCGHTATQQSNIIFHIRVVHFGLPQTLKQQRELNIIDERDPKELVEKLTT